MARSQRMSMRALPSVVDAYVQLALGLFAGDVDPILEALLFAGVESVRRADRGHHPVGAPLFVSTSARMRACARGCLCAVA